MSMWCVAPLEMNEGNSLGQGYNRPTGCSAVKALHATFYSPGQCVVLFVIHLHKIFYVGSSHVTLSF